MTHLLILRQFPQPLAACEATSTVEESLSLASHLPWVDCPECQMYAKALTPSRE